QFNFHNLEFLKAILEVHYEENYPLILGISESGLNYMGEDFVKGFILTIERNYKNLPIVIHLDHGKNLEIILKAIKLGFSSVMIDGSSLDFESNVKITSEVVNICHKIGISVEGEIGQLKGSDYMTDPDEAKKFVELTNVDALAISIGTRHGAYKGEVKLDFDRLKKIKSLLPNTFLVLHGASSVYDNYINLINHYGGKIFSASGIPDEHYILAINYGIRKINIDTDLRIAFVYGIRKFLFENPSEIDPR
ncbi:MAG: class II fructose-bisphosphate aldolase, partial [candidate division WOR-3 bacterium]